MVLAPHGISRSAYQCGHGIIETLGIALAAPQACCKAQAQEAAGRQECLKGWLQCTQAAIGVERCRRPGLRWRIDELGERPRARGGLFGSVHDTTEHGGRMWPEAGQIRCRAGDYEKHVANFVEELPRGRIVVLGAWSVAVAQRAA